LYQFTNFLYLNVLDMYMWDISLIHMPKDFDLQLHVTLKISSFIYM